jgi:hypothetical protein
MRMANVSQASFMNRLKQLNPFTRKNNGATDQAQGPSFFNRINPFKKNNTVKNNGSSFFNRINPFKKNNTVKNNGSSFFNRINPFKKNNVKLPNTNVVVNNSVGTNNLRGGRKSRKNRNRR